MRALLGIAVVLASVTSQSCPPQYQLLEGRCVRPLVLQQSQILANVLPGYRNECRNDGATLPIIKNDDENAMFNRIANSFDEIKGKDASLVLDMVCNTASRRLQWVDGTSITYTPKGSNEMNFDCVLMMITTISSVSSAKWSNFPTSIPEITTILCVRDAMEDQCGGYSLMEDSTATKPCMKVFTNPMSWAAAEQSCEDDFGSLLTIYSAEENKFFWRTAITYGLVEGMHIGAHQSKADPSTWTWIDGEIPFDGKTYDNFISSFPIPGAGQCASMLTESTTGLWINEDCDTNKQPFICRREDFSSLPKNCPTDAPKPGNIVYSPGFPNSVAPCEYVLFVAANKLVELEILTLATDVGRDFLEVFEGPSGSKILANLTGSIIAPTKISTAKSNVMRVKWITNGAGTSRGFRIRYSEVDP